MPPETKTPPKSFREHIESVVADATKDAPQDAKAAALAGSIPAFSKGTLPIDPATQQPLEPPTFDSTQVALPEDKPAAAPPAAVAPTAPATALAPPSAPAATAVAPSDQPTAPAAVTPAAAAAAGAAVEAAIPDVWSDAVDFEFEDLDLSEGGSPVKVPIRVPKAYAETAKRGYGRRAAYDRAISRFNQADRTLRPLIEDGRMARILPLIERAFADPEYGELVWRAYERRVAGLPAIDQPRPTQAPPTQAAVAAPGAPPELDDPYLSPYLTPLQAQLQEVRQQLSTLTQSQQTAEQQRQAAQRQQALQAEQQRQAHQHLASMYPGMYRPDLAGNDPTFNRAIQFARDAGYFQQYDLKAAIIFGAQGVAAIEAERAALSGSPAAEVLQTIEARQLAEASAQAAASARAGAGGAVAAPGPALPAGPGPKPSTKRADGSLKAPDEYMSEVAAWVQRGGGR